MKKILFTLIIGSIGSISFAQNVGINTTGATPDASAALDIDYTDKGLLIPRVSLTSTTDVVTIPAPATSLLVYNTNAAMTSGAIGYWYWDGSAWIQAIGPAGAAGPQGPAGAAGPVGPAGANGVTFMTGVSLTGDRQITSGSYAAVPGMPNLTFTATTTSAMVIFSASGLAYTNSMSNVFFRIRNGATTLGGTNTAMQSYDDTRGTITPWSCSYTRFLTGLVVGNSYTLSVQGYVNGIWGTPNAAIFTSSSPNENHMSLNVIQ